MANTLAAEMARLMFPGKTDEEIIIILANAEQGETTETLAKEQAEQAKEEDQAEEREKETITYKKGYQCIKTKNDRFMVEHPTTGTTRILEGVKTGKHCYKSGKLKHSVDVTFTLPRKGKGKGKGGPTKSEAKSLRRSEEHDNRSCGCSMIHSCPAVRNGNRENALRPDDS